MSSDDRIGMSAAPLFHIAGVSGLYRRPHDVVIVAALPRNPSGKVLKTALRAAYGAAAPVV
jgi:acyl-CoA synthetase (AMP-forming)/AMP-acid ligase II